MIKMVLSAAALLLLSGCGVQTEPWKVKAANEACSAYGGVDYYYFSNTILDPPYAVCSDGRKIIIRRPENK